MKTPVAKKEVEKLKVGDVVYLSGEIVTARDMAHKRAIGLSKVPVNLNVIYHSGPLVKRCKKEWKIISCGPTTSFRFSEIAEKVIKKFGTSLVIGKGGMKKSALKTLKKNRCAYLLFTGGCGVLAAKSVKRVKSVEWLDLGMPEALWTLEVEKFGPLVVAMDCHEKSIF